MPRRRSATIGAWFTNQMWNTSLPWLLGLFVIGAGFYFNTTAKLEDLDKKASELQIAIKETKKTDLAEREKARDAFLQDSKSTASGIAELNKLTAVMGNTLINVQKELEKIGQKLDNSQPIRPR